MTVDGVMLHSIVSELQQVIGGKIDKVYQPSIDEIHLSLRMKNRSLRLLLSANPSNCRIHLTAHPKANPPQPPMFCMLLRKHLTNARILSICQPSLERIVEITLQAWDEFRGNVSFRLVLEIMSRHSNLIFVDSDNKIVDSIKHVNAAMSSVRVVLPGYPYQDAPSQGKKDPLSITKEELVESLSQRGMGPLDKYLSSFLTGISGACARELIVRCFGQNNLFDPLTPEQSAALADTMLEFFQDLKKSRFRPALLFDGDTPFGFTPFPYASYASIRHDFMDANQALDSYYHLKETRDRFSQKAQGLMKAIQNRLKKITKKFTLQLEALESDEKMDRMRLFGELLTANMHAIPRGSHHATLTNYYDGAPITIPLDPAISPAANAQRFYKQYAKMRTAQTMAKDKVSALQLEIQYLESQLLYIAHCTEINDLEQIRTELETQGYLKAPPPSRKKIAVSASSPLHFRSLDGYDIWVGKNNAQNDALTFGAAPEDLWMHARNMPGSHVIIKHPKNIGAAGLLQGAMLAAYHSKGKTSQNVPVDYCLRKHVKKPTGSKPGAVIYTSHKTLYVTPEEETVQSLKVQS